MRRNLLATTAVMFLAQCLGYASWLTQTVDLKNGWNAIYTHVDASHTSLEALLSLSDPNAVIQEIWLWKPKLSSRQFFNTPQEPVGETTQWLSWKRSSTINSLQKLVGDAAYLVRVANADLFSWRIKGRVVPQNYTWTTTGLNFVGFPTNPADPPDFSSFFSLSPNLVRLPEVYQYAGGSLGDNPARIFAYDFTDVRRGEAFWIRTEDHFNRVFGPFDLELQNPEGILFGDWLGRYQIRLRNLTAATLTVTAAWVDSEADPDGVTPRPVPLLARGQLDTTALTHAAESFTDNPLRSWVLAPNGQAGSSIEIVLGVDRSQMNGAQGELFAGILRWTDSLNIVQQDIPVSARIASTTGLWVGEAKVNQVRHNLATYAKDATGQVQQHTTGAYIVTQQNTSFGTVVRPYALRLILHNPVTGPVTLLQRVFHGVNAAGQPVLTTTQAILDPDKLDVSRRMSAVHLPFIDGQAGWPFETSGELEQGQTLSVTVNLPYNSQASNPFLHTYHPDHDNRDATFIAEQPRGAESYDVERRITLEVLPQGTDFLSRTTGRQTLSGKYSETIAIRAEEGESKEFAVQGVFSINRISEIENLVSQ